MATQGALSSDEASRGKVRLKQNNDNEKERKTMGAYKWKVNGICKVDADEVGKLCEGLEKGTGLTAKNLVDASREEGSLLHDEFEWDDAVAGEKYREEQARKIIINLAVTVEDREDGGAERAYVSIDRGSKSYESITTVLADTEKTTVLLDLALRDLQAFKRKYARLKELAGVFRAIDKLI